VELTAEGFHYRVIDEGGSDLIRRRVFHSMLETRSRFSPAATRPVRALPPSTTTSRRRGGEPGLVKLFARRSARCHAD